MNSRKITLIKKATLLFAIAAIAVTLAVTGTGFDKSTDIARAEVGYAPAEYTSSGSLTELRDELCNHGSWDGALVPKGNYPITTAEDFLALADIVAHQSVAGSVFYLVPKEGETDIDFASQSISQVGGAEGQPFDGVFDGRGLTIKNVSGESLFGSIASTGEVKNFTLNNATITAVAAVAALNAGVIERVAVVESTVTSVDTAAALVAQNTGTIKNSFALSVTLTDGQEGSASGALVHTNSGTLSSSFVADVKNAAGAEVLKLGVTMSSASISSYAVTETPSSSTQISTADAKAGRLTVLLGDAFGQLVGTDDYPVFLLKGEVETHQVYTITISITNRSQTKTTWGNKGATVSADFVSGNPEYVKYTLTLDDAPFVFDETQIAGNTALTLTEYIDFPACGKGTKENPFVITNIDALEILSYARNNLIYLAVGDGTNLNLATAYIYTRLDADITFENNFTQDETLGKVISVTDSETEYLFDYINNFWYLASNTAAALDATTDAALIQVLQGKLDVWQPMTYRGEFDGNGHAVNNLYVNTSGDCAGFFGNFSGNLKALTVDGFVRGNNYVGGVIGGLNGGECTLTEVVNKATVIGNKRVGGIVGYADSVINVYNSINYGVISGNDSVGGFVGYISQRNANVYNSINYGDIGGSESKNVSGFIGFAYAYNPTNIYDSINYGQVLGYDCLGGFIGIAWSSPNLYNCANYGDIGDIAYGGSIGGFIGYNLYGALGIYNSLNYGNISGTTRIGGFVGFTDTTQTLSNVVNLGEVKAREGSAGQFVGAQEEWASNVIINSFYIAGDGLKPTGNSNDLGDTASITLSEDGTYMLSEGKLIDVFYATDLLSALRAGQSNLTGAYPWCYDADGKLAFVAREMCNTVTYIYTPEGQSTVTKTQFVYGEAIAPALSTVSFGEKIIAFWNTNPEATLTSEGNIAVGTIFTVGADITLYAVLREAPIYTVDFYDYSHRLASETNSNSPNYGRFGTKTITYYGAKQITLPEAPLYYKIGIEDISSARSPFGTDFVGWHTNINVDPDDPSILVAGATVTLDIDDNIILYAIWRNKNFESGMGTQNDPFIISTPTQLSNILTTPWMDYEGICFKLSNNIVLNEMSEVTIGESVVNAIIVTDTKGDSGDANAKYAFSGTNWYSAGVVDVVDTATTLTLVDNTTTTAKLLGLVNKFLPIGLSQEGRDGHFGGNIEGAGFEIEGIYINSADVPSADGGDLARLGFIRVSGGVELRNLTISGFLIGTIKNMLLGGFIADDRGFYRDTIIENCNNKITIIGASGTVAGGFIGYLDNPKTVTITNSHNYGSITVGGTGVGGFIGSICTAGNVTIINSNNYGSITVGGTGVGGFIGHNRIARYYNAATISISGSKNSGAITGHSKVGGFIGNSEGTRPITIEGSRNDGAITANGDNGAGGFIGSVSAATIITVTITTCQNNGEIKVSASASGGFIGNAQGGGTVINITDSINYLKVTAADHAGGFVGHNQSGATVNITGCKNLGDISAGTNNSGGFVGFNHGKAVSITDSENHGDISASSNNGGGFIGQNESGTATISASKNHGAISASMQAGGFVGYNGNATVKIDGCKNFGDISANGNNSSGFIGQLNGGTATITGSENSGVISARTNGAGFIGLNRAAATIEGGINTGSITVSGVHTQAAGFVAMNNVSLTIRNSVNEGNVTAEGDGCSTGGFIGYVYDNPTITIENCINRGNVSTNEYFSGDRLGFAGGIVGDLNSSSITLNMSNVENNGTITGCKGSGGLVGKAYTSAVNIINSNNYGAVIATGSPNSSTQMPFAGGLMGWIVTGTINIRNSANHGDVSVDRARTDLTSALVGGIVGQINDGPTVTGQRLVNFGTLTKGGDAARVGEILGRSNSTTTITNSFGANAKAIADGTSSSGSTYNAYTPVYDEVETTLIVGYNVQSGEQTETLFNLLNMEAYHNSDYNAWGFVAEGKVGWIDKSTLSIATIYYSEDVQVEIFVTNEPYIIDVDNHPQGGYALIGWSLTPNPTAENKDFEANEITTVTADAIYYAIYESLFVGDGTKDNPYEISNKEDLIRLSDAVNRGIAKNGAYYRQTEDIILSDIQLVTIGGKVYVTAMETVDYYWDIVESKIYKLESDALVEVTDTEAKNAAYTAIRTSFNEALGKVMTPIGQQGSAFNGVYDGNHKTISGLVCMSEVSENYGDGGLFGAIESATLMNINLENVLMGGLYDAAGALVGNAKGSQIIKCTVSDMFGIELKASSLGGLMGSAHDVTVSDSRVKGLLIAADISYFGGLIGQSYSVYITGAAAIDVEVFANSTDTSDYTGVGGFVGQSAFITIIDSFAQNIQITSSAKTIGGLIGIGYHPDFYGNAIIIDSAVKGLNIYGSRDNGYQSIGGLVGDVKNSAITIEASSVTEATLKAIYNYSSLGGLIGKAYPNESHLELSVKNSFAEVEITDADYMYVGGLAGHVYADEEDMYYENATLIVENSYAILDVTYSQDETVNSVAAGGMIGFVYGIPVLVIKNSYAVSKFPSAQKFAVDDKTYGESLIGGLIGQVHVGTANLENCFAMSNIAAEYSDCITGNINELCGVSDSNIDFSGCATFAVDRAIAGGYSITGPVSEASLLKTLNISALSNAAYKLWAGGENGATPVFGRASTALSFVDSNGNAIGKFTGADGRVYISGQGTIYYTTDGTIPTLSSAVYGIIGIAITDITTITAVVLDSMGIPQTDVISQTFSAPVVIVFDGTTVAGGSVPDSITCGAGDIVGLPFDSTLSAENGARLLGWTTNPDGNADTLVGAFFRAILPSDAGNTITLYPVWGEAPVSVWDGVSANAELAFEEDSSYFNYEINSAADLAGIAQIITNGTIQSQSSKTIKILLNVDIDLNGYAWTPISNVDKQLVLIGNGHTIYNLYVAEGAEYGGLFGEVKNIIVSSLNIIGAEVHGQMGAGAVFGAIWQRADLRNITVQNASITGLANANIGGIGGIIGRVYTNGGIYNNAVIGVKLNGGMCAGGLVGYAFFGDNEVENNFVLAEFNSTATQGLLFGQISGEYNQSILRNNYASGSLPFIGHLQSGVLALQEDLIRLTLAENGYSTLTHVDAEYDLLQIMNIGALLLGEDYYGWQMTAGGLPVINFTAATQTEDSYTFTDSDTFVANPAFAWYFNNPDADVYYISTAQEFAAFSALSVESGLDFLGKTIILTANIDISDYNVSPVGAGLNSNKYFRGVFDGGGFEISGIKNALFGTVAVVSTIKNLTVRGEIHEMKYFTSVYSSYTGNAAIAITLRGTILNCVSYVNVSDSVNSGNGIAIGGLAAISEYGIIKDSKNYGSVTGANIQIVGGVLGYAVHQNVIENSHNYGKVTGRNAVYIGGIVGATTNKAGIVTTIKNCENHGIVTGSKTPATGLYLGGITGYAGAGTVIEGCENLGAVSGSDASSHLYIGGITGYMVAGISIKNSVNRGDIAGTMATYFYGAGIVGYANQNTAIEGCENYGGITSERVSSHISIGGIVGNAAVSVSIKNSSNYGNISGKSATNGFIGGIAGFAGDSNIIEGCENHGDLTGIECNYINIGGIVGYAHENVTITENENYGSVLGCRAGNNYVGGIVGYALTGTLIKLSNNYGEITGNYAVCGAGGIAGGTNGVTIYRCANYGSATANDNWNSVGVGGLIGLSSGSTIESSTNYGAVSAGNNPDANEVAAGGFVGANVAGTLNVYNSANFGTVSNKSVNTGAYTGGLIGYVQEGLVLDNSVHFGKSSYAALVGESYSSSSVTVTRCGALQASGSIDEGAYIFVSDRNVLGGFAITEGLDGINNSASLLAYLNAGAVDSRVEGRMGWQVVDGGLAPTAIIANYDVTVTLTKMRVSETSVVGENAASSLAAYVLAFTTSTGYSFPASVNVFVGGVQLGGDFFTWDAENGILTVFTEAITDHISVVADGVLNEYSVTTQVGEGGTVSVAPTSANHFEVITATYSADLGWEIDKIQIRVGDNNWVDITADAAGNYSFILEGETQVRAIFKKTIYKLTVVANDSEFGVETEQTMGQEIKFETDSLRKTILSLKYTVDGVVYTIFGSGTTGTEYTLTMPAADVKVDIVYELVYGISVDNVTVTNETTGEVPEGTNTVIVADTASVGDTVTARASIAAGFTFVEMEVLQGTQRIAYSNVSTSLEFTMPSGAVTIKLTVAVAAYEITVELPTEWVDGVECTALADSYAYGQSLSFGVPITQIAGTYRVFLETESGIVRELTVGDAETYTQFAFNMPAENATVRVILNVAESRPIVLGEGVDKIRVYNYDDGTEGAEIFEITSEINRILIKCIAGYSIVSGTVVCGEGESVVFGIDDEGNIYANIDSAWVGTTFTISASFVPLLTAMPVVSTEGSSYSVISSGGDEVVSAGSDPEGCVAGTELKIKPELVAGYRVALVEYCTNGAWTALTADAEGNYPFTMPGTPTSTRVQFEKIRYSISVAMHEGSETGMGIVDVTAFAFAGDLVEFTSRPSVGYMHYYTKITNSAGHPIELTEPGVKSFTMPASDVTITVGFERESYIIAIDEQSVGEFLVTTDERGVVETDAHITSAKYQDIVYILIAKGYTAEVSVTDGRNAIKVWQNSDGLYYFLMPATAAATVKATLTAIDYRVTSSITGDGRVEFSKWDGNEWQKMGATLTANIGDQIRADYAGGIGCEYDIAELSRGEISERSTTYCLFTMTDGNTVLSVTFRAIEYSLTLRKGDNYSITLRGDTTGSTAGSTMTPYFNDLVTVRVELANGYRLTGLYYTVEGSEDSVPIGFVNGAYSFTMPAGSVTVDATIETILYTMTFDTNGGSIINPIQFTVEDTYMMYPANRTGYIFAYWEIIASPDDESCVGVTWQAPFEVSNKWGNMTVRANWLLCDHSLDVGEEGSVVVVPPTCTATGHTWRVCSVCRAEYERIEDIVPVIEHSFVDEVTAQPTCTEVGHLTHTCSTCGETKVDEIDARGHEYNTEFTVDVAATCTNAGSQSRHCKNCDTVTEVTVIERLGHTLEFTQAVLPSVENMTDGYDLCTCIRCDATEYRNIVRYETLIPPVLMTNIESIDLSNYVLGTALPVPELQGYVFEGWYTDPTYQGNALESVDTLEKDTVLYAKWALAAQTPKGGVSDGAVAGIVIGCILLTLIAAFVALYLIEKKRGPVLSKAFVKVDEIVQKLGHKPTGTNDPSPSGGTDGAKVVEQAQKEGDDATQATEPQPEAEQTAEEVQPDAQESVQEDASVQEEEEFGRGVEDVRAEEATATEVEAEVGTEQTAEESAQTEEAISVEEPENNAGDDYKKD